LTMKRKVASVRCSAKADKKRSGERVEAIFLERAVSQGLAIAKPWGDSERYDFIIDAGGKLCRVQVKSSSYKPIGRYGYHFKAYTRSSKRGNAYTADQIDVLAAYIVPENVWFIIPLEALNHAMAFMVHTYPPRNPNNRSQHRAHDFEPYREAWWILGAEKSAGAKAGAARNP